MTQGRHERRRAGWAPAWRQVLETAREAYVVIDAEARLVDLNRQACSLFGVDQARAVGRDAASLVVPGSRDRFRAALGGAHGAHPGGDHDPLELRMVGAFGQEFQAELSVWGVERRGGTLLHAFVRDVTSRREQEQAAALLAAVVEGSSDAVLTETPQGDITSWNAAAERTFGWLAKDVLGEPSVLLVPPEHLAEHHRLVAAVLDGERVRGLQTERVTRAGTVVPVSLRMSPVYDGVGRVIAVSTTARDVTEERWMASTLDRTLTALEQAADEAYAAEEASRRFLADAAHQLRTPLVGVRTCVELLRAAEPEDQQRLLAALAAEADRAGRLLAGLLRIARVDSQPLAVEDDVDVVALCRDEVERLRVVAAALEVRLEVGPDVPLVRADPDGVREVLSNLGDNARRHAVSSVTCAVQAAGGQVQISVRDDGPGVAAEVRERVFERFASLDGKGGSGLGLPIARALARGMGGDLVCDGGFVLLLPAR